MKKLLKHISPLAPDDSGACSVLYELGGITVICDAGGCAGNVCGFDEPRWFEKRSALFSAGLRDMDAILGRDDMLVKKLALVCEQVDARFCAIVGTPVPAVIATDMKALARMSEKKTGIPCLSLPTDGTKLYDKGEELAYYRIFEKFAKEKLPVIPKSIGVIGATPLDTGQTNAEAIIKSLRADGYQKVVCFGLDSGLDDIINASQWEEVMVIAPGGVKAAEYLRETFGTKIRYGFVGIPQEVRREAENLPAGSRVLVIHQQLAADAVRQLVPTGCEVMCASWFMMNETLRAWRDGDTHIGGEDDFRELAENGGFDVIFADNRLRRAAKGFTGQWVDFPHFAVSGRLMRGEA